MRLVDELSPVMLPPIFTGPSAPVELRSCR
jgi:hypothetical protein